MVLEVREIMLFFFECHDTMGTLLVRTSQVRIHLYLLFWGDLKYPEYSTDHFFPTFPMGSLNLTCQGKVRKPRCI